MTLRYLMMFIECPIELRSGPRSRSKKVPTCRIGEHLDEVVTKIVPRGAKLVICSEVPDYELDVDVDYPTEDGLPWDE